MKQINKICISLIISIFTVATITPYKTRIDKSFLTTKSSKSTKKSVISKKNQDVWITVLIHGSVTHLIRRLTPGLIISLAKDKVEGTIYQHSTRFMRSDPFFWRAQAMQELGLLKINKKEIKADGCATATALTMDLVDSWINGRKKDCNHYYTYGWHGVVGKQRRYQASLKLYDALLKELKIYKARGIKPKIRIIGYSHGGNVALQLAQVSKNKKDKKPLIIDQLVTMGTPLHANIDYLASSPTFKKIYNIYSKQDKVQRMDMLASNRMFSRRMFVKRKGFTPPSNLTQVRLRIVRNRTTRKKWPKEKDPRRNFLNPRVISASSPLLRVISPGHCELWFFGWSRKGYRELFPLNPLPSVAFVPAIIKGIENNRQDGVSRYTVDLRPEQEAMIIKGKKLISVEKLLTKEQFNHARSVAYIFSIPKDTNEDHVHHVKMAVKRGRREMAQPIQKQAPNNLIR